MAPVAGVDGCRAGWIVVHDECATVHRDFATVLQIMTSGQAVVDPELGLDYSRVVHGEQEYEWRRPVKVGDKLRATPRIADIYARGPNEFLVIEAEIKDASGETVAIARSTLLSRGTASGG